MPLPSNLVAIVIGWYLRFWKSVPSFQKMKIHQNLILEMMGPNSGWSNVIKWVKTSILMHCRRFHTSLPWERFYCERTFDAGNNGYQQCSIYSIVQCTPIVAKNIPPLIHKRQEGKIKSHWKTIDFCVYLFESEIIQLIIHLTIDWCVCIWWVSQPLIDHSKHEDVD